MERSSFLLEIGTEEIPVDYILPAVEQLGIDLGNWLAEERLEHGEIITLATPRRLAVIVEDLQLGQKDHEDEVTGPPVAAAYRDGEPTKAATGFARGQGVDMDQLYTVQTPKGEYLAAIKKTPGRSSSDLLAAEIPNLIQGIRFPKTMIWGDGNLRFARPIRWLVALLGEDVVPVKLGTLEAGRVSYGHRLAAPDPVEITGASAYEDILAGAQVEVDHRLRREGLLNQARAATREMGGLLVEDDQLTNTINFLVEKPLALAGTFDREFLALPREVISTAMKAHQRYFSVEDAAGNLLPGFIVVLNGPREHVDLVLRGNEMVLRARLEDARFYWEDDCRTGLEGMLAKLESVVWMEGFGNIADRSRRLVRLSGLIADLLPGDTCDRESLVWAAHYCKADLASEMVKDGKEFTKLQGYMGQAYALADGVAENRARMILEHSFPRFAGDRLPCDTESMILALSDRLDAICGFWLAGFAPTGSKDPYALRRQALGVLRILSEGELPLDLLELLKVSLAGYPDTGDLPPGTADDLLEFFSGRLQRMLEEQGVVRDIYDAIFFTGESRVLDLRARALALNALRGDQSFEKLIIGARRVANILAKEGWQGDPGESLALLQKWTVGGSTGFGFSEELLEEEAERSLCGVLKTRAVDLTRAAETRDYTAAYRVLADLGSDIDAYFDGVMVNAKEPALRGNRLAFLKNLSQIFLYFADFSRVVLEGERE
jgi:glycyl-tRNA synthetase beta chain